MSTIFVVTEGEYTEGQPDNVMGAYRTVAAAKAAVMARATEMLEPEDQNHYRWHGNYSYFDMGGPEGFAWSITETTLMD